MLNEFDPRNTTLPPELFDAIKHGDTIIVTTPHGQHSFVWDAFSCVGRRDPGCGDGAAQATGRRVFSIQKSSAVGKTEALKWQVQAVLAQMREMLAAPLIARIESEMLLREQRPNKGPQGDIEPWKRRGRRKK